MIETSYVILDSDSRRRTEVYRSLAAARSSIPLANVDELGAAWPESAWFLVPDDQEILAQLLRAFAERECFHPIIVYGEELSAERIVAAMHSGAMDYLLWPFDLATVEKSTARVSNVARKRCEQAAARIAIQARLAALTTREREVVMAVRAGFTNKEIARELGISPRTVEIHRSNALAKMGAKNSADATRMLVEAEDGLIEGREAA